MPAVHTIEKRLANLGAIRQLLSEQEYNEKRKEILLGI